ncbi:MAG: sensor histidine kinase [Chloroflexota bacterium]
MPDTLPEPIVSIDPTAPAQLRVALDRKEAEQRELDEFISLLAHDLRTPLTSIRGYAQLMLRQRRDIPNDDSVSSGLRTIVEQSDRLATMTEALLDVSRVRLGRIALKPGYVNLTVLAERAAAIWDGPPPALDLPDGELKVRGDSNRLHLLLRALARYVAGRTGAGSATLRLSQNAGSATLIVEDDGAPDADAGNLLDRLVVPKQAGSGWQLGHPDLYVARGVAQAHRGTLIVESPIAGSSQGVRFSLVLPLADETVP